MKKYFYIRNGQKLGPFTLEQIKNQSLTPETMVWYPGLDEWTAARHITELTPFLAAEPIDAGQPVYEPVVEKPEKPVLPPRSWLVESILATIFCCLPFGIAGIVYAARVENRFYSGDIEGAKAASREAKRWTMLSFWIGLAFIILTIIMKIIFFFAFGWAMFDYSNF